MLAKLYRGDTKTVVRDIIACATQQWWGIVNFLYFANAMRFRLWEKPRDERDSAYADALEAWSFLLPDGIALQVRDYAVHKPRSRLHNLNGTDLTPHVLKAAAEYCHSHDATLQICIMSLYDVRIGKWPEWLQRSQKKLEAEYWCKTYAFQVPYVQRHMLEEPPLVWEHLPYSPGTIRILLNATWTPVQELWSHTHREWLEKHHMLVMNIGGFLDFYTGLEQRAPKWIVRMRVWEALYRLVTNPRKNMKKIAPMFGIVRLRWKWILDRLHRLSTKK